MINRRFIQSSSALGFAVIIILSWPGATRAQATFQDIGRLPGASFSLVHGVSADGSVVVGESGTPPPQPTDEAFYWTSASGIVGIGRLPGAFCPCSWALDASSDGSVIVGTTNSESGEQAFRWTSAGGMVGLGALLGTPPGGRVSSQAEAVSADGTVVVGYSSSTSGSQAFRWTNETGMVGLGALSYARDVSADGAVIVGSVYPPAGRGEAFRWTESTGMVGLGFLPGGLPGDVQSDAFAVSADGSVVVGRTYFFADEQRRQEAFRWTSAEGMVGLGDLPGGNFESIPRAVSADGSVIVGSSASGSGAEAFIWTKADGIRNLREVLIAAGAPGLDGRVLSSAEGISADGRTIVGSAWIATLPTPLQGDYNQNGIVDAADYVVWRDSVGQMGTALVADGDRSGAVDAGDYNVWRAHFGESAANASASFKLLSAGLPEPSTRTIAALPVAFLLSTMFGRRGALAPLAR